MSTVTWARFSPSSSSTGREQHTPVIDGVRLLGTVWPEKDSENSGYSRTDGNYQSNYSKVEIMWKSFNSLFPPSAPQPPVNKCVISWTSRDFPFLDTGNPPSLTWLANRWLHREQVRSKVPVWAPRVHSKLFHRKCSAVIEDPLHLFVLNYFTVRNQKYNFSTSFQNY